MAYSRPRNPPIDPSKAPKYPGPVDIGKGIWETINAPLAGLWQGLGGKNLNYDQWIREKARKRRGRAPGRYPGRGPINWLSRTITGK